MICYAYHKKKSQSLKMTDTLGNSIDVTFLFSSLSIAETFFQHVDYELTGEVDFDMDENADGWFATGMWFKLKGTFFHSKTGPAVWGGSLRYDNDAKINSPFFLRGSELSFDDWLSSTTVSDDLPEKERALLLLQYS